MLVDYGTVQGVQWVKWIVFAHSSLTLNSGVPCQEGPFTFVETQLVQDMTCNYQMVRLVIGHLHFINLSSGQKVSIKKIWRTSSRAHLWGMGSGRTLVSYIDLTMYGLNVWLNQLVESQVGEFVQYRTTSRTSSIQIETQSCGLMPLTWGWQSE